MDDTDSPEGGCTTHLAYTIVKSISDSVDFLDYPNLIRLNPNIPYRTRGNGSVVLRFKVNDKETIKEKIIKIFTNYYERNYANTNPGLVFVENRIPEEIRKFSRKALEEVIPIELAKKLIEKLKLEYYGYGKMRGLIGATAGIGNLLRGDYTYELLTYRDVKEHKRTRNIDFNSVKKMDEKYRDYVFSNIDYETNTLLIAPHGPDPVVYGIRGEIPDILIEEMKQIRVSPPIDSWIIFRTNQATGEHLKAIKPISFIRPYRTHIVEGYVLTHPKMMEGGHVNFVIGDHTGRIECMAYEPSGNFRKNVLALRKHDYVRAYGGIKPASNKHPLTLNIERLDILRLHEEAKFLNPICPKCGKRMKSAGKNKGYKCKKCGYRSKEVKPMKIIIDRKIKQGVYIPPPRAQRHLTRPIERLNRSNEGKEIRLIDTWFE